ncbi:MAG: hypothetical protein GX251_11125 [Firmicutes bacterium]|nr:hypothetical protein [Bacillota bacterium]
MKNILPKKHLLCTVRALLTAILLTTLWQGTAGADVEVFFLPESGFLRVQGEVTMEPLSSSPSFLLFPSAQITELWADGLMEYKVQRGVHGTMISISLNQARPQVLSFAYEGFLNLQGSTLFLDRNSLWFPEFSFPIGSTEINVTLSDGWELTGWKSKPPLYPAFAVQNLNADMDQIAEEPQDASVEIPVVDELQSRIQMQVSRLTNAINQRNATEIAALLDPALRETGLADYLASFPHSHGKLSSEVKDPLTVLFSSDRGFRYQASTVWQEQGGRLVLQSFKLKPSGPQIPGDLDASLREFAQQLRLSIEAKNREQVLLYLDENLAQEHSQVLEFLLSLNAAAAWSVEHAVLVPFTVTLYIPQSEGTKLLLNLGLSPGPEHWLVNRVEVIPLR